MMIQQLSLFYSPQIEEPDYQPGQSIEERFDAFHGRNPQVYKALRQLALDMRGRGVRHYGIKALFEVLRYEYALRTEGDTFKLNNNYTALYARLLMEQEPELAGFFETRRRLTEVAA